MVTHDLGACEWFVWDLRRSSLIDRGQLDQIVGEFLKRNPRAEAPQLAEYLVQQGTLTGFQAERILNGKTQGLVLGPYVLADAIGRMPDRVRSVFVFYYYEGLTLAEIGRLLGVTESRVCQIHTKGLARLRDHLAPSRSAREPACA